MKVLRIMEDDVNTEIPCTLDRLQSNALTVPDDVVY